MKRGIFIKSSLFTIFPFFFSKRIMKWEDKRQTMRVRLLRHATLVVELNGKRILVDPMLSKKDAMDPVANAANNDRIPLVDLPLNDDELNKLIETTDAVLLTHIHRDHWDVAAQRLIDKNKLIVCQPADEEKIKAQGFTNVKSIEKNFIWNDISIFRTNGQHGTGEIGKKMGIVSGFVLQYKKDRLYIAGDTIWCNDVQEAITAYKPTYIIVNGGGARFLEGDPITMTTNDVVELAKFTNTSMSVVHLDTINHCLQRRPDFRAALEEKSLTSRVSIPGDGDWVNIS
jgi:L-ascorbate metabolism protein UlaG (beta-lactamase superfamily)